MTHYVHRIEKHVLKYIVTYDDFTFGFFLENNYDVYMADKKNDYVFFTKNFDNEANTMNAYEKLWSLSAVTAGEKTRLYKQ